MSYDSLKSNSISRSERSTRSSEFAESKSSLAQLDESILAKAFRGELVPQDPRDEPASELLARIRTTREQAESPSKPRGRTKRATQRTSKPPSPSSSDEPDPVSTRSPAQRHRSDSETEIHVLSIKQPWADAILFGDKWCENRSWATRYRGPLYIHAGQNLHETDREGIPGNRQRGAILGCVNLVEVLDLEELGEQEVRRIARSYELSTSRAAMWHVMASQCWIMTEPQALKQPIETKGTLNVWKYTARQSQLKFHRNRMSAVTSPDAAAWKPPSIDTPHPIDEWSKDELMAWIRQVFNNGGPRLWSLCRCGKTGKG